LALLIVTNSEFDKAKAKLTGIVREVCVLRSRSEIYRRRQGRKFIGESLLPGYSGVGSFVVAMEGEEEPHLRSADAYSRALEVCEA
jgi:hypothetical protein